MSGLTEAIARFVADVDWGDLPPVAIEKSSRVLADTFAVILAGAGSEVADPLGKYVARAAQSGDRRVLGTALSTSPEVAALVNGTFGHSLDFDDVLTMMPGHPSAIIVAAVLACLGERPISGPDLLLAHIVGIEVGAKIGLAITHGHYDRGFHGTGTLGIFSALGALAKLHRLDPATTRIAFGIASSMASGVRRNFGTMTKPLHTGWAARSAITAIELARCGFTAAPDALEAPAGFFASYGVEGSNPAAAIDKLGNPWTVVTPGIGLKKWPCYNGSQRAMAGVLELREKLGLTADTLHSVECRMPPGGMKVVIYPRPTTGLEGKFSLQYVLAAGVLDGQYSMWTFTDEAVRRPAIQQLYDRVRAYEVDRIGAADPLLRTRPAGERGFAEVEIKTIDGRSETIQVDAAPGHPKREMSWLDIEQKFSDCAAHSPIAKPRSEQAFGLLRRLADVPDINAIVDLLTLHP